MADMATPVFQVISAVKHEPAVDVINIRAEGPAECPPGTPSVLTVTPAAGAQTVTPLPLRDWKLPVPAAVSAEILDAAQPWEHPGMHPFCLPDLPARTWRVAFSACPAKGLGMSVSIKAFPGLYWTGQVSVRISAENGPARPRVEGGLEMRLDGRSRTIDNWRQLRSIFPVLEMMDDLTRTVNAVNDFTSPRNSRGLDSSRLQWRDPFHWDPAPSLSLRLESRLYEQWASGLLGHYLELHLQGEPLAGATGEANVLPLLITNALAEKRLAPLTRGRPGSITELSTRYGVYLVAAGRCTLIGSLRSVRPVEPISQRFLSQGEVTFALEGRSDTEFESITVSSTAATNAAEGTRFAVTLEAPPEAPLPEPRDRKPKMQAAFTGLHFHALERQSGSVRIRPWQPSQEDTEQKEKEAPKPVAVLPARLWPRGTEPGQTEEIPWCPEA